MNALPVAVPVGSTYRAGTLLVPEGARGIVYVHASTLQIQPGLVSLLYSDRFGVLQVDLLTPEERVAACRNDVELLANRLACATDWLAYVGPGSELPIGYVATGIGSAAALMAAATRPSLVSAVVSCSGRPLLARPALPQVRAPTLLIALSSDAALVKVNRAALAQLHCEKHLELIDKPQSMADLAQQWLERHLVSSEPA